MKLPIRHGRKPAAGNRQRFDDSMSAWPGVIGIFPKRRDFPDLPDFPDMLDLPGEMNRQNSPPKQGGEPEGHVSSI